jgi:hypothetical protein
MSVGLHLYHHDFVLRAAPTVIGVREDGEAWTYDAFIQHVLTLGFEGQMRLRGALDQFLADEEADKAAKRAAAAVIERAEDERIRADPVAYAERELTRAEACLSDFEKRLPTDDALAKQDELIAQLEQRRLSVKHGPQPWLTLSRELEIARIERERLALLAAEPRAGRAGALARVAEARAALEAAKMRAARHEQPVAADAAE